ncbi:uncharacterized protein F4822DRAFT_444193 [Hypoxylon trugodes]|uniref:uncharacterized protein n=1 Tax=Hypoxylon trugodes TaxID=326681 RepID=UPI00218FEE64|nr:uncharacterized protein F4822DRAFT_444193 [Hypoxylon trugodes]KAI1387548.1 hypothetical protein F4822DRAFT_444193 [Hypoxylon trugodes]
MVELISSEAQITRDHITSDGDRTRLMIESESTQRHLEKTRNRMLSTLWFPETNQRENNITESSDDIVDMIFPNSEFSDWLQSDGSVFWISGKPGSGKSILMKYLIHDTHTMEFLRRWKPSVQVFRFYFYEIGLNNLQRQLAGCVRTLLHQIIDKNPNVFEVLLRSQPEIRMKMSAYDWNLRELFDALSTCLRCEVSVSCLFLDGLDEIQTDGRQNIVKIVEFLKDITNVKICVASRPEIMFRQHLSHYPTLRVQDLTNNAIHSYARTSLQEYRNSDRYMSLFETPEERYQRFLEEFVAMSNGVFLWAALALRSVVGGIENGDSLILLNQRIYEFAPNLNELYEQMWKKQNEDSQVYKKQASEIFWYISQSEHDNTVLCHLLATNQELRRELQQIILTRSTGLLEIVKRDSARPDTTTYTKGFRAQVQFIHRSVREFLEGTKNGQQVMNHDQRSPEARDLAYVSAQMDAAYVFAAEGWKVAKVPLTPWIWGIDPMEWYTRAMNWMDHLRLNGIGEKQYQEWMASNIKESMSQNVLVASAGAGDAAVLNRVHQQEEAFERIPSQQKAAILVHCCGKFFVLMSVTDNGISSVTLDYFEMFGFNSLWRYVDCIKWLLENGADPHMILKPGAATSLEFTVWLPISLLDFSAFRLFSSLAIFSTMHIFSDMPMRLDWWSWPSAQEFIVIIQRVIKIFGKLKNGDLRDHVTLKIRPRSSVMPQVRFSTNITQNSEFINRITHADNPADARAIRDRYAETNFIEIHAIKFKGSGWQRLATNNEIGKITSLKVAFAAALFEPDYVTEDKIGSELEDALEAIALEEPDTSDSDMSDADSSMSN